MESAAGMQSDTSTFMSAMTVWHTRWMHNSSKGRASRAARVITGSTTRVPWWVMHQPKARVPNSSATWSIRLKAALASARAVSLPLPECQCVSLIAFVHIARLMQATEAGNEAGHNAVPQAVAMFMLVKQCRPLLMYL